MQESLHSAEHQGTQEEMPSHMTQEETPSHMTQQQDGDQHDRQVGASCHSDGPPPRAEEAQQQPPDQLQVHMTASAAQERAGSIEPAASGPPQEVSATATGSNASTSDAASAAATTAADAGSTAVDYSAAVDVAEAQASNAVADNSTSRAQASTAVADDTGEMQQQSDVGLDLGHLPAVVVHAGGGDWATNSMQSSPIYGVASQVTPSHNRLAGSPKPGVHRLEIESFPQFEADKCTDD